MKVVVSDTNLAPHRGLLASALPAGTVLCWIEAGDESALLAELPDADVFVGTRFTAEMAAVAGRLRLVHAAGAGYDGIRLDALAPGTPCANTSHHGDSIAEYVMAALVVLRRGLLGQAAALRAGRWASSVYDPAIPQPSTLHGARVAFLGFGGIGSAAWRLLRPLGAIGIAITRKGDVDVREHGLERATGVAGLATALADCDALVVSIPLNAETTGLIGARELDLLGPAGVLVNVARGPVVDESALYAALSSRAIAGAALDVWYRYPAEGIGAPSTLPFGGLDNVLMTPHVSGVTEDTFRGRALDIAENVARLQAGRPLRNVVNLRKTTTQDER